MLSFAFRLIIEADYVLHFNLHIRMFACVL